jgi:hypothetical protein
MRDYIQHALHLVSCTVANPIDMMTQVHVFVTGMNAGFQCFYSTRKPAATLEEAFATELREDYSVTASRAFPTSTKQCRWRSTRSSRTRRTATTRRRAAPRPWRLQRTKSDDLLPLSQALVIARPSAAHRLQCSLPPTVPSALSPPDSKKRRRPVREARPTGQTEELSSLVAEPPPSPAVLHAQLNATTSSSDKRLIVLSLHVSGAQRPIRVLLDSGATNNFVRAESLSVLPRDLQVREGPGSMVVKYADGKPRQQPRRSVKFAYSFNDFYEDDDFLLIDLSGSFDCVFGMPWLSRHQPNVDWLNRTVHPRGIDVDGVLAFLRSSTNNNL